MGHYLSDMETHEESLYRRLYSPMKERIRTYDQERARGIRHTKKWRKQMEQERAQLTEAGYSV